MPKNIRERNLDKNNKIKVIKIDITINLYPSECIFGKILSIIIIYLIILS